MTESTSEALESEKKRAPASSGKPGGSEGEPAHEHGDDVFGHDEHAGHGAYPFLQHHFDTPQQQFDAGKMGIWLFLLTEVLFFAGLFCAYTVYRAQHPEIFVWAHYYLDTSLGAVNTVVLLGSSLTAAWAVRCAQLKQKRGLIINILITIACACTFMGVKYVEYSHKFHDGLTWPGRAENPLFGVRFNPKHEVWELDTFKKKHPEAAELAHKLREESKAKRAEEASAAPAAPGASVAKPAQQTAEPPAGNPAEAPEKTADTSMPVPGPTAAGPKDTIAERASEMPIPSKLGAAAWPLRQAGLLRSSGELLEHPKNAHVFFSVYFFMTGLHGFHVLGGIVVWVWMLLRAMKNAFGESYFGPIDYAALYWHLVDLIWIYLFPLLYLIH